MDEEMKECLYLIQWYSDGQLQVTSGFQIEAIRHSEKKWYNGKPQMHIVREATSEDLILFPPEDEHEQSERNRCLKMMHHRRRHYIRNDGQKSTRKSSPS